MKLTRKQLREMLARNLNLIVEASRQALEELIIANQGKNFEMKVPTAIATAYGKPAAVKMRLVKTRRVKFYDSNGLEILALSADQVGSDIVNAFKSAIDRKNKEKKEQKGRDIASLKVKIKLEKDQIVGRIYYKGQLQYLERVSVANYKKYGNDHTSLVLGVLFPKATQDGFSKITAITPDLGKNANIQNAVVKKSVTQLRNIPEINEGERPGLPDSEDKDKKKDKKSDSKSDSGGTGSGGSGVSSRVRYIQKVIGTKVDGDWGKNTNAAWKSWLGANDSTNALAIGQIGISKGVDVTPEIIKKAYDDNNAGALAQAAGFKNTLSGVVAMVKELEKNSDEVKKAMALAFMQTDSGEQVVASKKNDTEEKEVIDVSESEAEAVIKQLEKIEDPERRQKVADKMARKIERELKRQDRGDKRSARKAKSAEKLAKGLMRIAPESKAAKDAAKRADELALSQATDGETTTASKKNETIQENLSRGALYRKRYYGRY